MRVRGKGRRKIRSEQKSRRLENNPPIHYGGSRVFFIFAHEVGFTFVGMLVAVSILSITASSIYTLTLSLHKGYNDQVAISNIQQEARVALSVFSTEVQQAGLDPSGQAFSLPAKKTKERYAPLFDPSQLCPTGPNKETSRDAHSIMEASPTVFHFMGDINKDGNFTGPNKDTNEDIRYEWVGAEGRMVCDAVKTPYTLYRDTGGEEQEVALGIREFKLTYFDENGAELINVPLNFTDRDKIRRINVTLRVETKDNRKEQQWTSDITLKNRT